MQNNEPNSKTVNKTVNNNKNKKKKKKKGRAKFWFYTFLFGFVFAVVVAIVGYLAIILQGEKILSENKDRLNFGEASIVYDINGNEITRLYDIEAETNREEAEFSEIPKVVIDAFVATEDRRFYEHSGLDFISIGRAVVKDIVAGSMVEGGSTITQQLAKNVFLTTDKTILRKATEASIAVALEQQMSKDQIITMYLNRIYFGKGVYGIKAAAKYYFDTELENLELWQAATLAAMPKAPNRYNPVNDPEASLERRQVVLQLMYQEGYISSQEELEKAKTAVYVEPEHVVQSDTHNKKYMAFIDFAVEEAKELTGLDELELRVGGYHIYTTLDPTAQEAVDKQFANDENFEESVDEELAQAAMVIIDHATGQIKAMAGGRDYVKKGLNRVNAKYQPGSTIKPLLSYGPALETGNYTPATIMNIDKTCFSNGKYCPSDKWGATPVSVKQALTESRNLAAVWLFNEIGINTGKQFAQKLGIEFEEDDNHLALALGGMSRGTTPLQMATAYAIIANKGKSVDAHSIVKIEGKTKTWKYEAPKQEQVIKESTAAYLTDILQSVITDGTGKRAAINGREVAGKTGTTQHSVAGLKSSANKNVWFVGYTPEWSAAIWMGYDYPKDGDHLLKKGSSQAASLFSKVMGEALSNTPKKSFNIAPIEVEETPAIAVNNLAATFVPEEISVHLSWEVDYEGVAYYDIYRREQGESDFIHFDETDGRTSVVDVSVFPGKKYEYYVIAYDAQLDLYSEPSATVTVDVPEMELTIPDVPMEIDDNLTEENPYYPEEPNNPNPNENGSGNGNGNENGNNGNGNGNNGNGNNGNGNGTNGNPGGQDQGNSTDTGTLPTEDDLLNMIDDIVNQVNN